MVIFRLYSPDGILLDTENVRPTDCRAAFRLSAPMLWEGRHANFKYRVDAFLQRDAAVLDDVSVTFGLRNAELTRDGFYQLNGLKLPLYGALLRDAKNVGDAMDAMVSLDANAVFTGALDPACRLPEVCDRLGLMLIYRFPCTGDERDFDELQRLLPLLRRHPSVAFIAYRSDDVAYAKTFCRLVHEGAPGVFCAGESSALTAESITDAVPDALLLNADAVGFDHDFDALAARFAALREAHPAYRYLVFARPPECLYDVHSTDPREPDGSQEYFSRWHEKLWEVFGNQKAVVAFCAGPLAPGGFAKLASLPARTAGKTIDVKCFSNLPSLSLSVNGKHRKRVQAQRLSESVFVFRDVRLRRRINTLVLNGRDATDSAVICRRKEKTRK